MDQGPSRAYRPHPADGGRTSRVLAVGTAVCVWNSFLEAFTEGFAVAEVLPRGYRLRRLSDGHVFEHVFPGTEIMSERRRPRPGEPWPPHFDRRHRDPEEELHRITEEGEPDTYSPVESPRL